jgi:anti-anti-sigma factor
MYEISSVDDVTVLHLSGEVSHTEMLTIENVIGKLMKTSKNKIVLNFKKVEHVNYKTISRLLENATTLRSLEGDLKCASLNHYNQKIFKFTGADQVVESYDSVYDAIMSFNGDQEKHRTWH